MNKHFEQVARFNTLSGNPKGDPDKFDYAAAEAQMGLILEEVEELIDELEINQWKFTPIKKEVCDVLVVTYGMYHRLGYEPPCETDLSLWSCGGSEKYLVEQLEKYVDFLLQNILNPCREIQYIKKCLEAILSATYSLAKLLDSIFDFDVDQAFQAVHESNMSKFCRNHNEWKESYDHYANLGVEVECRGDYPELVIISSKDQSANGKHYAKGKILKSIAFKEAVL